MTKDQMEAVRNAVVEAFAVLTDAELATLVMEPFAEVRQGQLANAA